MNTKTNIRRRSAKGFTLIELMVTVGIIAILSTIVYPSYTKSVRKSRRTEAKTALLDLAGREEKRFSTMNSYSTTPSDLQYSSLNLANDYTVAITLPTATTFSITATAVGGQAADTDCATLTVDSTGTQSSTDSSGAASNCW